MTERQSDKILMSGGSGLLGTALQKIDPNIVAPQRATMDVTNLDSLMAAFKIYKPDVFIHAAAFTSPPSCDRDPMEALEINIVGTANVVCVAQKTNTKLVYISTDYVFKGDRGNYTEDDELLPQNKYAWSKLGGECAVRLYDNSLIIRTSFYPDEFPYPAAFVDQYTSRDTVTTIAELIYAVIVSDTSEPIVHIGTERKTVKELALKMGKNDVKDLTRKEVSFATPVDTSLNLEKMHQLLQDQI